jgi:hypothetical protein
MLQILKSIASRLLSITAGNTPVSPEAVATATSHACYAPCDVVSRWQGDIYPANSFAPGALPSTESNIPYWMLVNRTCLLVEAGGRKCKLGHLTFCAVVPLSKFVGPSPKSLKNAITNLVAQKDEFACFLPALPTCGVLVPLAANFSLIWTVPIANAPTAKAKVLQLSSPFSEHVFQRFSRWFYTVGYDDSGHRDDRHIQSLIKQVEAEIAAETTAKTSSGSP